MNGTGSMAGQSNQLRAKAETPIEQALSYVESRINHLEEIAVAIESRLDPLCAPSPEKPHGLTAGESLGGSAIVGRLSNFGSRLNLLNDRLQRLLSGLEV